MECRVKSTVATGWRLASLDERSTVNGRMHAPAEAGALAANGADRCHRRVDERGRLVARAAQRPETNLRRSSGAIPVSTQR